MSCDKIKKQKVDIFKLPLTGIKLIEASAGTGKTFTIVLLYLRLLLGIGENNKTIKELSINQILVVTFTNAAKEELHFRIKNYINSLFLTCINKNSTDPILNLFLKKIVNIDKAIYLLNKAKNKIDCAAIYTIHEFCNNMLNSHTFDNNIIFSKKMIQNEELLYLKATEDFWRTYFYLLPKEIINIINKEYSNPLSLLKKIKPILKIPLKNFCYQFYERETLITRHKRNIQKINNFKKKWLLNKNKIYEFIKNININQKIYNKFNVKRWIKNITIWSNTKTTNYNIPLALKYFKQKKITENSLHKNVKKNIFFKNIDIFLNQKFTLNNIITFNAVKKISQIIKKDKEKKMILEFDDLLQILLKNLKNNHFLKKYIQEKYPAAFIDEFQDTDLYQYHIFNLIYSKQKNIVLFLIGDPKQAIYSFRGADIFSYIYAKSKINNHYYLDKNWRSSVDICKSINILFSKHPNPFLDKNISFIPIVSSSNNLNINFKIKGKIQKAFHFFLQPKKQVSINEYHDWIAKQCANEISYWLTLARKKEAIITTKKGEKILTPNDISILVRNKNEADVIQRALKNVNIMSIYTSNKENIFNTIDAQELLYILKSILEPTNEHLLQQIKNTHIFQKYNFIKNNINKNVNYVFIEKLYLYQYFWNKIGIFYMIYKIIENYKENRILLKTEYNEQTSLNFLYLGELLEKKSQKIYKKQTLIRWFQQKILTIDISSKKHIIPLLKNNNFIKIITIHKSKGLEYPITWIPFSVDFNQKKSAIYHDTKTLEKYVDIEQENESFQKAEKERLEEDIRLLYVALTRSIVHCSIGISALIKKKYKRTNDHSDIHKSALGYIVQNGYSMNYNSLYKILKKNSKNNVITIKKNTLKIKFIQKKEKICIEKKHDYLNKNIYKNWKIISYTELYKESILSKKNTINIDIEKKISNFIENKSNTLNINNFPRGKNTGNLMHNILQNIKFEKIKNSIAIDKNIQQYNIQKKWNPLLIKWINKILHSNLNKKNIVLSKLKHNEYIQELDFFLPIKKTLYNVELNKIIQSLDPISSLSPKIYFDKVTGILQGFIDLFFLWEKKYYILDYKTNWLGNEKNSYSQMNIQKEMIKKRYDLQYQIYTLAINQYLTKKLKKYNYHEQFGGIFYLFLRGINDKNENNGIFYTKPNYKLIKKLSFLLLGKTT